MMPVLLAARSAGTPASEWKWGLREWMPTTTIWCLDSGDPDDRVEAVKRFIDTHLPEPFDVADLSREAGLSRGHFSRVFREREGCSPWDYVLSRRVARARELLEEGMRPSDAALGAGFYDQSHLSRVFRRMEGTTPARYRKDRTIVQDDGDAAP